MMAADAGVVLLMAPELARRMDVTLARFLDVATLLDNWRRSLGARWNEPAREIAGSLILPFCIFITAAIASTLPRQASSSPSPDWSAAVADRRPRALFSVRSALEFLKGLAKVAAGFLPSLPAC